jgi:hypothetical protein
MRTYIPAIAAAALFAIPAAASLWYERGGPEHKKKASAARSAITPRLVLGERLVDVAARRRVTSSRVRRGQRH